MLSGRAHAAADGALPSGHWNGGDNERVRVCLDLLPHAGIRLTIYAPEEREPLVIDGSYQIAEQKAEPPSLQKDGQPDAELTLKMTVAKIRTKELSPCRKYWIVAERTQARQLGVVFRPHAVIQLTLRLGCTNKRSTAHLCIVAANGSATCRDLRSDRTQTACKPGPPTRAVIESDPPPPDSSSHSHTPLETL